MSSLTQKAIKVINNLLKLSDEELLKKINEHESVGFDRILEASGMLNSEQISEEDLKLFLNRIYFNRH